MALSVKISFSCGEGQDPPPSSCAAPARSLSSNVGYKSITVHGPVCLGLLCGPAFLSRSVMWPSLPKSLPSRCHYSSSHRLTSELSEKGHDSFVFDRIQFPGIPYQQRPTAFVVAICLTVCWQSSFENSELLLDVECMYSAVLCQISTFIDLVLLVNTEN